MSGNDNAKRRHGVSRRSVGLASVAVLAASAVPGASRTAEVAAISSDPRMIELEAALQKVRAAVETEIAIDTLGNSAGHAAAMAQTEATEAELKALADRILGAPVTNLSDVALRARLAEHWWGQRDDLFIDEVRYAVALVRSILELTELEPMPRRPRISSVAELVVALGGREAVAVKCGIAPEEVARWERTGTVPTGWHHRFAVQAGRRGYLLDPDFFGEFA